jgi:Spy/CpxP family protein refolding chaperone
MKKFYTILTLSLMLLAAVPVSAQTSGSQKARMEKPAGPRVPKRPSMQQFVQDKTNFILREMKLSVEDSARFAPVYIQLQMEKANLMRTHLEVGRKAREAYRGLSPDQWPDSVKLAMVRAEYRLGVEDATLELHYLGRFEQILTPEQLLRYTHAEKSFKQKFMGGPERRPRSEKKSDKADK